MRQFTLPSLILLVLTLAFAPCIFAQSGAQDEVRPNTVSTTFTESVIANFAAGSGFGAYIGAPAQANNGNFYATTSVGGASTKGNIVQITPGGTVTNLHSFSNSGSGGYNPAAGPVEGNDGALYGVTTSNGCFYRITTGGSFTLLHCFAGGVSDGGEPEGAPLLGTDGNFYGVTQTGGTNNLGVVYSISPVSPYTETVLYSFAGGTGDGSMAYGGLVQGTDGNLYGMTKTGGAHNLGVIYQISFTSPYTETVIHSFAGGSADGSQPYDALVQGTDGNFYGTTSAGGSAGQGAIFKLSSTSPYTVTVLHSFASGTSDGQNPYSSLVEGTDGNFYGTTYSGGTHGVGTIFQVTSAGAYTLLHSFSNATTDGSGGYGGMVQGLDGNFYGITYIGGANNRGAVYKLTPSPAFTAPVQLTPPTSVGTGGSFQMGYLVSNSYNGSQPGTMNTCTAFNNAGDTTVWTGTFTAEPTSQSKTLTAPSSTGTYTYTLTCGGVETGTASLVVTYHPTTTVVSANPTTILPTGSTVVTATVTDQTAPANSPSGSVTFKVGSTTLGSCTLSSGACGITVAGSSLAIGSNTITATYTPSTGWLTSTGTTTVNVNYDSTSTAVSASPSTIAPTGSSTVTATVTDTTNPGSTPAGPVTFTVNSTTLGSCTLSSGSCSITVAGSALLTGSNTITATYSPTTGWQSSSGTTSVAVTVGTITFTSVTHSFGSVPVGTAATAYGVAVKNTSTTTAYPYSLVFTPANGFTSATNCTSTLAAGASCEVVFYFTPTAVGTVTANWSLTPQNNFGYSPSNGGTLSGTGTSAGAVTLTTNGHNFGTQTVGTTSAAYGTELSNSTGTAETISLGPLPSGPFTMLTNCGTTLAAGASCEIEFNFAPTNNSPVSVVVPLSGTPTAITSGGAALPGGGITLSGN